MDFQRRDVIQFRTYGESHEDRIRREQREERELERLLEICEKYEDTKDECSSGF